MYSRRSILGGLASIGLWPIKSPLASTVVDPTIRYGWDPNIDAPTQASLYVSPEGNDAADGSLAHPLRTIQRGVDLLSALPSGSISVREGVYREEVCLDSLQGQRDANYRIHRHGRERVQISAAEILDGWEPCSSSDAAELGFANEGVFVARFSSAILKHNSIYALNLYEAGDWRSIGTDRADISDPERNGDFKTYHPAQFLLDSKDKIVAIRDTRLIGSTVAQMAQAKVLVYHEPNTVSGNTIADFDPLTGTITLSDSSRTVLRTAGKPVMFYALQNTASALGERQWIVRKNAAQEVSIYLRPANPKNLADGIEISLRSTCIDLGHARGVELLGLEVLRASGHHRLDGICIRCTKSGSGNDQNLRITNCRVGENFSEADRGYGALYIHGASGVAIQNTSIGPARNNFGIFLSGCVNADLRFLHITGVSKSPARFYGLRQSVLAFSLFEDSAHDAHANKFNFYEGCDAVLVYGVRTRHVGGYATYQEASRIHFAFCELDCSVNSQNRALVSQSRNPDSGQGGADGSGDPVAGSTFFYWNNSLLADPRTPKKANSFVLGPIGTSQHHVFHNNILHGGGFEAIYRNGIDSNHEKRSNNRYTGLSFWQRARYGWRLGVGEEMMRIGERPRKSGADMRPIIEQELVTLFPNFREWHLDIDGSLVDWGAAPIGCKV